MKKRIIAAVCAVLVIAAAGGGVIWAYNNPVISLQRFGVTPQQGQSAQPELVFEWISIGESRRLGLPRPAKLDEEMKAFTAKTDEYKKDINDNYTSPMKVTVSLMVKDGKTLVTYSGYATTKQGVTEDYYRQDEFNFVLAETLE